MIEENTNYIVLIYNKTGDLVLLNMVDSILEISNANMWVTHDLLVAILNGSTILGVL